MKELFNDLPHNEMLQHTLYDEKYIVGFGEIASRISDKYNLQKPSELFEPTFAYLLPLLQEGKIKMRISDVHRRLVLPRDLVIFPLREVGVDEMILQKNFREYSSANANDAIERLRTTISQLIPSFYDSIKFEDMTPEQRKQLEPLSDFEFHGVQITLAENEWLGPLPTQDDV